MDRRALFFLCASVVCGALIPVTAGKFRWVPIVLAALYVVLAAASHVDSRSRRESDSHGRAKTDQPNRPVM
jgi:hypothetical protein